MLLLFWLIPAALLLTGGGWLSPQGTLAVPARGAGQEGVSSPIGDWTDDFDDDIDDVDDDLGEAERAIGSAEGPLAEPELSEVADNLNGVLAIINRILDPMQYPSLDPPDAGSVDDRVAPVTLPGYAKSCSDLIADAREELHSTVVDHQVIGSHLKTIRSLIIRSSPHNYRTLAGISE
ncbi:MAG: hypothetical protein ACYS0D_04420 [Planctomycetota bacterium]